MILLFYRLANVIVTSNQYRVEGSIQLFTHQRFISQVINRTFGARIISEQTKNK